MMGEPLFRPGQRLGAGVGEDAAPGVDTEVERDRESLRTLMGILAVPVHRYKVLGGWVSEKAARFKPNGCLLRRSRSATSSSARAEQQQTLWNNCEYTPQPTYSPPPETPAKGKPAPWWSGPGQASTCSRMAQWGARSPLRVPCLAGRGGPGSVRECGE